MKCLSVTQPWASLIVVGAKRIETRGWQTGYRGTLAIHAARKFPQSLRDLCAREPLRSLLHQAGHKSWRSLPLGALIGTVELLDCLPVEDLGPVSVSDRAFADLRPGRWAWLLDRPRSLAAPVPMSGRLGVFDILDFEARQAASRA